MTFIIWFICSKQCHRNNRTFSSKQSAIRVSVPKEQTPPVSIQKCSTICGLASEFFILPLAKTGSINRSKESIVLWTSRSSNTRSLEASHLSGRRNTYDMFYYPPTPCLQGGARSEKGRGTTATVTTTTTITRPKPPCYRGCRAMQVKTLVFFAGFKRDVWYWVGSNVCQKWVRWTGQPMLFPCCGIFFFGLLTRKSRYLAFGARIWWFLCEIVAKPGQNLNATGDAGQCKSYSGLRPKREVSIGLGT